MLGKIVAILLFCLSSSSFAKSSLLVSFDLVVDGELKSRPTILLTEGQPAEMQLDSDGAGLRIQVLVESGMQKAHGGPSKIVQFQLHTRSSGSTDWVVAGAPGIAVGLGESFSIQVSDPGGSNRYELSGQLAEATEEQLRDACSSCRDSAEHCKSSVDHWLRDRKGDAGEGLASDCCQVGCENGLTLRCCGGCCWDNWNGCHCCPP